MSAITWAAFGDVVQAPGPLEIPGPYFVLHRCTDAKRAAYLCVTHQLQLANLGQLEMHVDDGGDHHLVVWCATHQQCEELGATS